VLWQPGRQVGGGGLAEGAAAAVELAKGNIGLALGLTSLPAFKPAPIQKVLGDAGVAQLVSRDALN
jgi:hypothetical protein